MKLPITPRALKTVAIPLAVALVICVFLNLRVFNYFFVEDSIEAYSIHHMTNFGGRVPFAPKVKIILIREKQHDATAPWGDGDRKHRQFFAELIRRMTAAKAKVLAFDVSFVGKSEEFDKEFGEAVANAKKEGLAVIVGAEKYANGKIEPEIPENFNQPNWGLIDVGSYQGNENENAPIRAMKLADKDATNGNAVIPSLPLRIVMDSQSLVPELDVEWNRLNLYADGAKQQLAQSIPLERGHYMFIDQASRGDLDAATVDAQTISNDFKDTDALRRKYHDAIVLVGYEMGESKNVLVGGKRLGVELHATAVSNILNRVFITKVYLIYSYFIVVVMALLALVMNTSFGAQFKYSVEVRVPGTNLKLPIPIGLLIIGVVYLAFVSAIFLYWRRYLDVPYHLAALGLSYFLLWLIFTKLAPRREGSLTSL